MVPDLSDATLEARRIVRFLETRRWPLSDEKRLQEAISGEMERSHMEHRREVRLNGADIIDFMVGDIGIEVKIGGSKRAIFRQCERYAEHESVSAIVIATAKAMGVPPEVNGKPILVALLGMGAF